MKQIQMPLNGEVLKPTIENKQLKVGTETIEVNSVVFLKSTFAENPKKGMELLFRRYYKALCSHAVRFVYSRQIAEDLVGEVFYQFYKVKAYENINSSFNSYLFRSVRNECYTYMHREFGKTDGLDTFHEATPTMFFEQPDAETHYNHLMIKINEVIGKLPMQCQRVFLMSRFENKKYQEIADELKISPRTVEVHISKALKSLRAELSQEWLT
jgi:RNA polymerase sigma-70 factor (family 1)